MQIAPTASPARRLVENAVGAIGGAAGSVAYALPAGLAGMNHAQDHYGRRDETGHNVCNYPMILGAASGILVGGGLGASSLGLTGGLVGAGLGFVVGGAGALALSWFHGAVAGKKDLENRLGDAVNQAVEHKIGRDNFPSYETRAKVSNGILGFRGGASAGIQEGYSVGREEARALAGGILDGLAVVPATLKGSLQAKTDPPDSQAGSPSTLRRVLGAPLGTAAGVLGAIATAPAGALQGREWEEGTAVAMVWGLEGTGVGALAGGILTGSLQGALGGALLGGLPFLVAGLSGWKKPAQIGQRIAEAVEAAERVRPTPDENGPIYSRIHENVRDTVVGGAAGLRVGFQAAYQLGSQATTFACDKAVDELAAGSSKVVSHIRQVPAVLGGVKDGLQ